MRLKIFVIHDSKVGAYMAPWTARSAGEATRNFENLVNDGKSMMSIYPSDFSLFEIGEYDEASGVLHPHNVLKSLGVAVEFKKQPQDAAPLLSSIAR